MAFEFTHIERMQARVANTDDQGATNKLIRCRQCGFTLATIHRPETMQAHLFGFHDDRYGIWRPTNNVLRKLGSDQRLAGAAGADGHEAAKARLKTGMDAYRRMRDEAGSYAPIPTRQLVTITDNEPTIQCPRCKTIQSGARAG